MTINSGGEKIFAEQVEAAIVHHLMVYDVTVVGRPSTQWGAEVVALVELAAGALATAEENVAEAAGMLHVASCPKTLCSATA